MNYSKATGFFPSGFFDSQIKQVSQEEKVISSLKKKYPERTVFSGECTHAAEWEEDFMECQIVPSTKIVVFAADEKFTAMELAAFLVGLEHKTIKIHQKGQINI